MPSRNINHRDSPSAVGDPRNFPGLSPGGGRKPVPKTDDTIVRIYQASLAAAITAAAAKSAAASRASR